MEQPVDKINNLIESTKDPILEKIEKEELDLQKQIDSQLNTITKECIKCKKTKTLKEFGLTKNGKDYYAKCIECREPKAVKKEEVIELEKSIPDITKTADVTKKVIDELTKIEKVNIEDIKQKMIKFDPKLNKEELDKLSDEDIVKKRNEMFTNKVVDAFGDQVPDSAEDFSFVLIKTVTGICEQLPQLKEKNIDLTGWTDSIEKNRKMNLALLKAMLKKNPQLVQNVLGPEVMLGLSIIGSGVAIAASNSAKKNQK
jgi:hypothetical protein